ncbi:MAG TPA: surface-adhesin E family protein [Longimicrobium sp.]|jgi:hypothetical protein
MKRHHLPALAALVCSTACGSGLPDPPAPWVAFHDGGGALASVDTSRLTVRDGVADVWLRFDYVEPDSMEGGEPFHRVDVHQRITCAAERVDDLVMETRDTTGRMIDQAPGSRWHTFGEHPFGEYIFPALCKRLPELAR